MRRTAAVSRICVAIGLVAAASTALAQRVRIPSMLDMDPNYSSPAPAIAAPSTVPVPSYPPVGAQPTLIQPPTATPYGVSPPFQPATPPPGAVLSGTVQPAPWDPYADPARASSVPYSPFAPSPYAPPPGVGGSGGVYPTAPPSQPLYPNGLPWSWGGSGSGGGDFFSQAQQPLKLLQETRGRYTFIPSLNGSDRLSVNDLELSATFAFPFFYEKAPFLVTPGFAFHWWGGPVTRPPANADLPPRTYDAFLDVGWQPQLTPWLAANLGVRTGVYSDFATFTTHSIRVMGRGLGVITVTPTLQVALGVVYLDRNRVKILPAGGIIWSPSADARLEFLFPNPRLARRLTTIQSAEIWGYIGGEYGGGAWTVHRLAGFSDAFDYNDIRAFIGLESFGQHGFKASAELGYVFKRELFYRSGLPSELDLNDSLMLRVGLSY